MRQKAQSIWFLVMLVTMGILPELGIIYAVNINNPILMLGTSSVHLDELAWAIMTFNALIGVACVFGSYFNEKILMKAHEK